MIFKKLVPAVILLSLAATMLFTGCQGGVKKVVNVYNWGEYIDESIFKEFEAQTGIKVVYQTYESNEALYAKIKGGGANYDVIIPSDYMVSRMISEGMLEKLNYENIPNISKIDETYLNREYDPANEYTVPYMWGTVGIIYNSKMIEDEITSWGALFDEKYAGKILMFDNSRDAMGIALLYLGYSINTTDKAQLDEAYQLLKAQSPCFRPMLWTRYLKSWKAEKPAIGPYYAGDYITMLETTPICASVSRRRAAVFVDCMCIPKEPKTRKTQRLS